MNYYKIITKLIGPIQFLKSKLDELNKFLKL